MELIKVQQVKSGEFFKRTTVNATKVYVRGAWVSPRDGGWSDGKGRYSCQDANDMNKEIFMKKDTLVHVGFTF